MFKLPHNCNAKECSNYHTITLISHTSKVMLKILQARLQQYVNQELRDVQAGFRKGRGPRDQIANILWIIEKAREFQKNIYFCYIDYTKAFDCVAHNKLENSEMAIPDHLTCLLRNLYAGQEARLRTGCGTMDWLQNGKGVCQSCILSPCLFNFYGEFSSVQFSHSVMSDSLQPHEPQHASPPHPSPTVWVYSNPCQLNWWCHPSISFSVVPFSSCPRSFPGSFQMSQLFTSGGQSIGVSASTSVLPMNTQDWSPLG